MKDEDALIWVRVVVFLGYIIGATSVIILPLLSIIPGAGVLFAILYMFGSTAVVISITPSVISLITMIGVETQNRSAIRRLSRWVFGKKHYERVFGPVLDDIQVEYAEALRASRMLACWVRLRGYFIFWHTVFAWTLSATVGRMLRFVFSIRVPGE